MEGLYTALVTPFTPEGDLDERGLRENIDFQIANGIDGLVALGTTGEAPTLTEEEKERVVQIAVEETRARVPLFVGTGSNSTRETLRRSKRAEELGADGLLIISPYYNKPTQEGLYRHFCAVADACSLPIMLYNHPGRTGITFELATLERLAVLPQVVGIKECGGKVGEIHAAIPQWSIMSGDDSQALQCLKEGAKGLISVLSNLMPKEMKLYLKGAIDLKQFIRATTLETNPIPIKAMMAAAGMAAGPTRLPLCDLREENQREIEGLCFSQSFKIHY